MKILFKEGKYDKVSDDLEADKKVRLYGWRYSTREEWKKNVRDIKKSEPVAVEKSELHKETKERRAKNHSKIKEKQIHQ